MKELDSFTVERLEELSTKENIPELAALARIALAAKSAENSHSRYEVWCRGNIWIQCSKRAYDRYNYQGERVRVLYERICGSQLLPTPSAWEINGILCHTKREADNYSGKKTPLYEALS